jgi:hypothetical protein
MSREVQVRFCERRGVRLPPPTLPVTVLFDEHGYRQLAVPVVRDHALLRPA